MQPTGLARYRAVYEVPGAVGFSAAGAVGRLPLAMTGLGVVLLVEASTGSYGLAGAAAAAVALGQAGVAPRVGRFADRRGQARVLVALMVVHALALAGLLAVLRGDGPAAAVVATALLLGGSLPPLGAFVRSRWTALLAGDRRLDTALAVESIVDEVVFVVGPVLVTVLATSVAAPAGLLVAQVLVLGGTTAFVLQPGSAPRPSGSPEPATRTRSALRVPGVAVLTATFVGVGAVFGSLDVGVVALTDAWDRPALAGALLAVFSLGSLVAGVVVGAATPTRPPGTRLAVGVLVLSVGTGGAALAATLPALAPLAVAGMLLVAGSAVAPTLITGTQLVPQILPPERATEGYAWVSVALFVGVAVGAPVAGAVVDAVGPVAALATSLAWGAGSLVAVLLGRAALVPRAAASPDLVLPVG